MPVLAEPLPVRGGRGRPVEDDYAHVILDEAQDLSPMECRMIARRAEYASMTIVGDLGQATHPLAAGSWPELLPGSAGATPGRWNCAPDTGYPEVIADFAARALPPGIAPTRSYRPGGRLAVRRGRRPGRGGGPGDRDGHRPRPPGRRPARDPGQSGQGPGVRPGGVVEPADIVAAEPRGMNRLYVALTRAVGELVILHRKPLPEQLTRA